MKKTIDHLLLHEGEMEKHHEKAIQKHKNLVPFDINLDTSEYGGAIIGKEVASFSSKMTDRQRLDFIMTKIFAQLHAEHEAKGSMEGESGKIWYKAYARCLSHVGYAIDGFSFGELESHKADASISEVAIQALIAAAIFTIPGAEVAAGNAVRKSLSAIKVADKDGDGKVTFFSHSASHAGEVKFQISAGTLNEAGNVSAVLGAYLTKNSKENTDFLWMSWSSSSQSVWYSSQMIELDDEVFSYIRSSMLERVKKFMIKYVKLIPLADDLGDLY